MAQVYEKLTTADVVSNIISKQNGNADKIKQDIENVEVAVSTKEAQLSQAISSEASTRSQEDTSIKKSVSDLSETMYQLIGTGVVGGDTVIKCEVFNIVHSDNGNGTFTYTDKDGKAHVEPLTSQGYQTFKLLEGNYNLGENKISITVNDTLQRSKASGGLEEVDKTTVLLTVPEGDGAEITIKYFEKLGLVGEHGITHGIGQYDEVAGLVSVGNTMPTAKKAVWFKVVG